MIIKYPFIHIAWEDGTLGTKWGPCLCGGDQPDPCLSCRHAEDLERRGLDWEDEYQRWLAEGEGVGREG